MSIHTPDSLTNDLPYDKRVSVLLPMRGLTEDFAETYQRLADTLGGDDEVVICDNSEQVTTEFFEALTKLEAQIQPSCQFRYVCNFENVGAQQNSITALKVAKGRYIHWVGDDDYWSDNFFDAQADFLDHNQDYAAVAGVVLGFTSKFHREDGPKFDVNGPSAVDRLSSMGAIQSHRFSGQAVRIPALYQFIHMTRRHALSPFLEFVDLFQGKMALYQGLTGPSYLLFGGIKTLDDVFYHKDQENWVPNSKLVTSWTGHYKSFGQPRITLAHHHYVLCAKLFLFGRFLRARFPHLIDESSDIENRLYWMEILKARAVYESVLALDDLTGEETAFLEKHPGELFEAGEPIECVKRVLLLLDDLNSNIAALMRHLFEQIT